MAQLSQRTERQLQRLQSHGCLMSSAWIPTLHFLYKTYVRRSLWIHAHWRGYLGLVTQCRISLHLVARHTAHGVHYYSLFLWNRITWRKAFCVKPKLPNGNLHLFIQCLWRKNAHFHGLRLCVYLRNERITNLSLVINPAKNSNIVNKTNQIVYLHHHSVDAN